jgi:hypothetical protein
VCLLDDDDGGVDEFAEGDGDASKGHDIDAYAYESKGNECKQHRCGHGEQERCSVGKVAEEQEDDQYDCDDDFGDCFTRRCVCPMDEGGTVIDREDLYPGWKGGLDLPRSPR